MEGVHNTDIYKRIEHLRSQTVARDPSNPVCRVTKHALSGKLCFLSDFRMTCGCMTFLRDAGPSGVLLARAIPGKFPALNMYLWYSSTEREEDHDFAVSVYEGQVLGRDIRVSCRTRTFVKGQVVPSAVSWWPSQLKLPPLCPGFRARPAV